MKRSFTSLNKFSSFCGVEAQHSFASLFVFDSLFLKYPPISITELGTSHGGLSNYFWLYCEIHQLLFLTIDLKDLRKFKKVNFLRGDLLNDKLFQQHLHYHLQKGKTFLYCDNGNKKKEIEIFASSLKAGSILGVHDWGVELTSKDVQLTSEFVELVEFNDLSDQLCTRQHFWMKERSD